MPGTILSPYNSLQPASFETSPSYSGSSYTSSATKTNVNFLLVLKLKNKNEEINNLIHVTVNCYLIQYSIPSCPEKKKNLHMFFSYASPATQTYIQFFLVLIKKINFRKIVRPPYL